MGEQAAARYQREIQIMAEPPMLKLFWQQFHALNTEGKLNHSRNPDLIALRLAEVVQAAKAQIFAPSRLNRTAPPAAPGQHPPAHGSQQGGQLRPAGQNRALHGVLSAAKRVGGQP